MSSLLTYHSPSSVADIELAYKVGNPLMAFEYTLQITPPMGAQAAAYYVSASEGLILPVTGFTVPDAGISITNTNSLLGGLDYQLNTGSMEISFLSNILGDSAIHGMWSIQYTDSGALSLEAFEHRPTATIVNNKTGEAIVTMYRCMFSFPKPTIKIGSSDLSVFTTTVSYKSILIKNRAI